MHQHENELEIIHEPSRNASMNRDMIISSDTIW